MIQVEHGCVCKDQFERQLHFSRDFVSVISLLHTPCILYVSIIFMHTHTHARTRGTVTPPNGSRKHSTLPERGSLHLVKKDGKEDPSTFVIMEGGIRTIARS